MSDNKHLSFKQKLKRSFYNRKTKNFKVEVTESKGSSSAKSIDVNLNKEFEEFRSFIKFNFKSLPLKEYKVPANLYSALENDIKNKNRPSIKCLQDIVIDMEHHLGYKNNTAIVNLEKNMGKEAGRIEKENYLFSEITILWDDMYSADNYIGIIAHELSHAYQHAKNAIFPNPKTERFTDFLTAYLGFGLIVLNGIKAIKTYVNYRVRLARLGYLTENEIQESLILADFDAKEKESVNSDIELSKTKIAKILECINLYKQNFNYIKEKIMSLQSNKLSQDNVIYCSKIYHELIESNCLDRINNFGKNIESLSINELEKIETSLNRELANVLEIISDLEKII